MKEGPPKIEKRESLLELHKKWDQEQGAELENKLREKEIRMGLKSMLKVFFAAIVVEQAVRYGLDLSLSQEEIIRSSAYAIATAVGFWKGAKVLFLTKGEEGEDKEDIQKAIGEQLDAMLVN